MYAHLESLVGIIRIFEDDKKYGDPYEWSAVFRYIDKITIEICGVDKPMTEEMWHAIRKLCNEEGITKAVFYRYKGSDTYRHTIVFEDGEFKNSIEKILPKPL